MWSSKEMRERARAKVAPQVAEQSLGEWDDVTIENDIASYTDLLVSFATAEVERAVRECIDVQCAWCRLGSPAARSDSPPRLAGVSWAWWHGPDQRCHSGVIHELLYQQQRASEEGGE